MAKEKTNARTPEVSANPQEEVAEKPRRFRNVSATLLTKDNSSPFPPRSSSELTEAEIARFQQATRQTGTTFIVEVKR